MVMTIIVVMTVGKDVHEAGGDIAPLMVTALEVVITMLIMMLKAMMVTIMVSMLLMMMMILIVTVMVMMMLLMIMKIMILVAKWC